MIPFHQNILGAAELANISEAVQSGSLAGDGDFCRLCEEEIARLTQAPAVLLTCSGTAALELAVLLLDIPPGSEIIMPSFTFTSTANAAALRGIRPVLVDIRPQDMNIDDTLIKAAITPATRGIIVMHYGGMACNMQAICDIARKHNLYIIEDAALGFLAKHNTDYLGTIGKLGCLSFHHSKHFSMGEGGALLINDTDLLQRAEILRQKGADIARFRRGEVDKYCWQDIGSSYVPSELNAACLLPQLGSAESTIEQLRDLWSCYQQGLMPLQQAGQIDLPQPEAYARHNGHIFYIKAKNAACREKLRSYLAQRGIACAGHYQPLHSAPAGQKYARFWGEDNYTTREAARLLRLPLWRGLTKTQVHEVIAAINDYYEQEEAWDD